MRMMFGGQIDKNDYHYFGWNYEFLNDYLVETGFKKIERVHPSESMSSDLVFVKERNREQLYALNLLYDTDVPLVTITGLAGSGKTYLTLLVGVEGLHSGKYSRIVITRNVQPVGRDIGFLPGDMNDKMLPWISPIMDNFRQGMKDKDLTYFKAMRDKGQIEIAPLAFMRGRTLKNSFAILDESQNATDTQIKMFLTRIGENSKIVVNGDPSQVDLINKRDSGLIKSKKILKDLEEIKIIEFDHNDVVRHPLVSKIIRAYQKKSTDDKN